MNTPIPLDIRPAIANSTVFIRIKNGRSISRANTCREYMLDGLRSAKRTGNTVALLLLPIAHVYGSTVIIPERYEAIETANTDFLRFVAHAVSIPVMALWNRPCAASERVFSSRVTKSPAWQHITPDGRQSFKILGWSGIPLEIFQEAPQLFHLAVGLYRTAIRVWLAGINPATFVIGSDEEIMEAVDNANQALIRAMFLALRENFRILSVAGGLNTNDYHVDNLLRAPATFRDWKTPRDFLTWGNDNEGVAAYG